MQNSESYLVPNIFSPFARVVAAQSTRHGGVSTFPYQSLNLGLHTADDPKRVIANRSIFFTGLGISEEEIAGSFQTHQDQIKIVDQAGQLEGFDALISNTPGLFVAVTIADCVPILVYDAEHQVVAAVHAGWRGTVARIVYKTLNQMKAAYMSKGENCFAFIGSCISLRCFEVGEEVATQFSDQLKVWDEDRKKFRVDLKMANKVQLLESGIPEYQIEVSPYCTFHDNDRFFSHRKEKGTTGRMLAVIGIKQISKG